MELYDFFRGLFAWSVVVAAAWPLNIPMLALAFKVQTGARPLPMDSEQLWWRSIFGALFLGLATIVFVVLDYVMTDWAEFPPGPIHLIIFAGFVAVAAWLLFVMFAHDDLFEGLSLFIIYIYLPVFVLYLFNRATGLFNPVLGYLETWIKPVV